MSVSPVSMILSILLTEKVQAMKNSVNKNDKKKRKEVMGQIEELQEQLKKQQLKELEDFKEKNGVEKEVNGKGEEWTERDGEVSEEEVSGLKYRETRISKAERKKEKKAEKEKERQHRIETEDVSHLNRSRVREDELIGEKMRDLGMKIFDIPSDGDCLYRAVQHQLELQNVPITISELRSKTARFIGENRDQFIPFLINEETGDIMSEEQIEEYCHDIESTAWGGDLELQSLAQSLARRINVVQSDGPVLTFGEEFAEESKLMLSYHRHAFSLGEHYNSLIPS